LIDVKPSRITYFVSCATLTRQDFNAYKKPTVIRRIHRRMGLARLTDMCEYARLLRQSPSEVTALADDLLIHVTGFFRDAPAWERCAGM
jgi:two-component system CheB/CheR fusion protein